MPDYHGRAIRENLIIRNNTSGLLYFAQLAKKPAKSE